MQTLSTTNVEIMCEMTIQFEKETPNNSIKTCVNESLLNDATKQLATGLFPALLLF